MNKWTAAFLSVFIMFTANTFAAGESSAPAIPVGATTATCNFATSWAVKFKARWVLSEYECPAGHYLPKNHTNCLDEDTVCKPDHFCEGGTYTYSTTQDQGTQACPDGMKSPAGAKSANDCGRILHVGNGKLYLHKNKQGSPSLAIQIGENTYYANMTPVSEGVKPMTSGTSSKLHIVSDGVHYTVHDSSVE